MVAIASGKSLRGQPSGGSGPLLTSRTRCCSSLPAWQASSPARFSLSTAVRSEAARGCGGNRFHKAAPRVPSFSGGLPGMIHYIGGRVGQLIILLIGVSMVVFFTMHMLPGDVAQLVLGEG